jgi:hypothetical protein
MAGERGDGVEVVQRRPVQAEPARPVGERALGRHARAQRAEIGAAPPALVALAAGGHEREDDMVARLERLHARTGLLHDTRGFVPEDERERLGQVALDDVQVAVADAAGRDADEHLAFLRRGEVDLENLDRPARLPEDGGLRLHAASVPLPSA